MARTQLEAKINADNSIYDSKTYPKVKKSTFPLSAKFSFTIDPGSYVPCDWWFTLPGDKFQIGARYILKSRPLVCAPFNAFHVRTHWFYCRLVDLWRGAPTWVTRGRSGSLRPTFPTFNPNANDVSANGSKYHYSAPQSLLSYLRLPPTALPLSNSINKNAVGDNYDISRITDNININSASNYKSTGYLLPNELSVLLPLMYQKIYRYDMTVPNLLQDCKAWFPDDLSDGWRISYSGDNVGAGKLPTSATDSTPSGTDQTADYYFHPTKQISLVTTSPDFAHNSPSVNDTAVNLLQLRSCLFEKDRFTASFPSSLRGAAPEISLDDVQITLDGIPIVNSDSSLAVGFSYHNANGNPLWIQPNTSRYVDSELKNVTDSPVAFPADTYQQVFASGSSSASITDTFSLNNIRELIALTVWQERNEQVQGSYNDMIFAHFGVSPRHQDYEPYYIGGTSEVIYFDEVVQTSESATTPLGTRAGISETQGSGKVGEFTCPDYGFIMGIMFISPETSYTTGVERPWDFKVMEDLYFPEDEGLGLQEVKNRELFISGEDSSDDDLFSWSNRDTDYKSRPNRALGFYALPPDVDAIFAARSQARIFKETPKLSHQFVTESLENVRRDYLVSINNPAFEVQFATLLRGNRPMAYRSIPETFGF